MDQSSNTPVAPPIQTPQNPQKPAGLPHLVVEEPKRGVFGTLGIIVLSLALLGIPLGIFLTSQQTQLTPQAAVEESIPEVDSGIVLESKLGASSNEVSVDVYVRSPIDAINLVDAKIKYDAGSLTVEKVATSAAEVNQPALFNRWVEASFDNNQGVVSLVAGLPAPGLKTGGPNDEKVYLATLHLKSNRPGAANLEVDASSQIFRNIDNVNIFKTGDSLALNLTSSGEASASASPTNNNEPMLVVTDPKPAVNYSYFRSLNITWSSFGVENISQINLLVNDEPLGPITENLDAEDGLYEWQINETLALPYIQPANTFKVEIVGVSRNGQVARAVSAPFGILGTEEVTGSITDLNALGQLRILDYSKALSNYLVLPLNDKSVDVNKDDVVNDLDLFLIRQSLLGNGVIE